MVPMRRHIFGSLTLFCMTALVGGMPPEAAQIDFEPLDCRWTFGNHEPISMYRRVGGRTTGGMEGSARWLDEWHHWFDSEACTRTMQELGLNMLHCRFYKGLGWEFEKKDFPNVKEFVANCHKHGIRALAYVQFATLYYEVMQNEVPDLADWAAVDENGRKRTYGTSYFRWMPCINAPGFEPYLKKVVKIALTEGGFDGIMFDNCFAPACYCPRCAALFRDYLAKEPNLESRFGIPTAAHVLPPPPPAKNAFGEVRDPICQRWLEFRCERMTALFRRLYLAGKACRPSAIMTGNVANLRRANMAYTTALNVPDQGDNFDILVSQSGNEPGVEGDHIINRVREFKLAQAMGSRILALSDADAGISSRAQAKYVLALVEDAVFGGIPTDRTVMKPDPQMVSRELIGARKPVLDRFNAMVQSGREGLQRSTYAPVKVLYSRESVMFSEQSYRAIVGAEEILLRNHVPYGLLPTVAGRELSPPDDCEVLLVNDQRCLSDGQVDALLRFAKAGGRLIVTGESGLYDEHYAQRKTWPFDQLRESKGVVCRREVDPLPSIEGGWTIKVGAPRDGGRRLLGDLASVWTPAIRVTAPPVVFAEVKRSPTGATVHLINYASEPVAEGVRLELGEAWPAIGSCTFAAPMEGREPAAMPISTPVSGRRSITLPAFVDYAAIELPRP